MPVVSGTEGYRSILQSGGSVRLNDLVPLGTETFVTYSYFDSWPTYASTTRVSLGSTTAEVISSTQRSAIRTALDLYSSASGLTFIEVPGDATTRGDVVFGMVGDIAGYSGLAYLPYDGMNRSASSLSGEIWLSRVDVGNMAVGSWGNWVLVHEIGHAIGFKHTFEGDTTLIAAEDNSNYTVMSYNVSPVPTKLGPYDVQAAQYLYGTRAAANANAVNGSWDATSQRVFITGGSASETILGTGWKDTIASGGGNDIVQGGSGDDILSGGDGSDTLSGGNGDDTLIGGTGNDTLIGNSGNDVAVFSRPRWEYRFSGSSISLTATGLTSAATAADGIDTLSGVEFIETNGVRVSTATAVANNLANATATGATAAAGQRRAISDFFTTSDPDGHAITQYRLVDRSAGGGRLVRVVGTSVTDLSATAPVTLNAADLGSVFFEGGASAGADTIEIGLYDGREWSQPTISITTTASANRAPVVSTAGTASVNVGASLAASALFSVSDPDGNAITGYEFRDANAGGGQLRLGGTALGNGIVAITPAQLASLTYAAGTAAGSEAIEIRATDGSLWSSWASVAVSTIQPNRAPVVSAAGTASVNVGASLAASALFSVSDPDGNAITGYEFRDANAGGGQLRLGGTALGNGIVAITPAQLASLTYAAGTAAGSEAIEIRATDGSLWSSWASVAVATTAPPPVSTMPNTPPTITTATTSVVANQWAQASTLFTASDPDGDAITAYRFTDLTNGNGYFWFGTAQATNTPLEVAAAQLGNVLFRGGASASTSDMVRIEAFDGASWGSREIAISTVAANRAPVVVASTGASVSTGGSIAVTAIFSASDPDGDTLTAYELWDSGAGGGQFRIGGVAQASGQAIALTPAQLGSTVYQGGATAGTETVWMRVKDATTWSTWANVSLPTTVSAEMIVVNEAPVVSTAGTASVNVGASLAASALFSVSDPDGNAITGYEFRDANAGGGQLRLGGTALGNGIVAITPAQLASLTYAAGTAAGSEAIEIRATDGSLWSSWASVAVSTIQPNRAPVVSAAGTASVNVGASLAASALFSVSDPDGNAITGYEFRDANAGGGQLRLGGTALGNGIVAITPAQLASLTYAAGTAAGSEAIEIRATDGSLWSSWASVAVATTVATVANTPPTITTATSSVAANQWVLASTLFTARDADGDAITAYRFTDLTNGNGYFWFGTVRAANTSFEVSAADMSNVLFRAGSVSPASDTLRIEAFDGTSWGSRDVVVSTAAANRAPTVTANLGASVIVGGSIPVTSIFSVSDPDGDAITAYEIWDSNPGGGGFRIGGTTSATGVPISLTPAELAITVYDGDKTASSEIVWMRAKDASAWSPWTSMNILTRTDLASLDLHGIPDPGSPSRCACCGCNLSSLDLAKGTDLQGAGSNDLGTLDHLFQAHGGIAGTGDGDGQWRAASSGDASSGGAFLAAFGDAERGVLSGGLR
jgi:hypothetical protein